MSVKEHSEGSPVCFSIHLYIYIYLCVCVYVCMSVHLGTRGVQQSPHHSSLGQSHLIHGKHEADK